MTGEFTSGWLAAEDLTDAEKALREAVMAHRWWQPLRDIAQVVTDQPQDADWGPERTVRAQVLYQLLTGKGPPSLDAEWDSPLRALRVRGARIVGQLDLEAATLRCPLELVGCWLDHDTAPVLLREATAPAIRIRGCWLPAGLDARQLTTRGDLDLRQCRVQGVVRLDGGQIGGQLDLSGGKFRDVDGPAHFADGLRVGQYVLCQDGFEADGEVNLSGGHVGGLVLSGGRFRNQGGTALNADGLQVDQYMLCRYGFEADGEVRLQGAHVGRQLNLRGGKFRNVGAIALFADGLQVDQDMVCRDGFEADGEVRLLSGRVGAQLDLTGGKFRNVGGMALNADGLQVDLAMFCRHGFEADGEVRLLGAHVGAQLDLRGAGLRNEGGTAFDATWVRVDGNLRWEPAEVLGRVSFAFVSVGVWSDSDEVMEIPLDLHRLRYDGLFPVPPEVTATQRIAWLGRDPDGYSPQPYSQLAAVYRAEGHDSAARKVLVASQARRRRQVSGWRGWPGRAWGGLLWATVGYGYRPWLALLWLVALVVGGSLVVDALPNSDFVEGSGAPAFNSLLYTVDVLLPFIDLGYSKWVAVGVAQVVTVVLVVLGWVLATAVIAAFAGMLRRGD